MAVLAGRSNGWSLLVNGTRIAGGSLASGDGYTRAEPFTFAAGVVAGASLRTIPIAVGDTVTLQLVRSSVAGYFVGVTERITATSSD